MPGETLVCRHARRVEEDPVIHSNGLLFILTLRCEAASELASRELDEALPRVERAALWCHLLACRSCRRFRKHLRRDP